MKLDQRLVDAAIALLDQRFPDEEGVAAALYTADGDIYTGVHFRLNGLSAARLCAETGPLLHAYALNKVVTASACVYRDPEDGRYLILAPCGICQERLYHWGPAVEVAVPHPDDPTRWLAKTLKEVQPYRWRSVLEKNGKK